ncbi:MAG TPA: hypothetical protein VFF06_16425 [Polyangia bacterium]|nr:hypothetical protein [Polyangia bacterium]
METYFTFPDGGLRYDCPSCGQRCCRGKGFALGADELIPLLARAPMLAAHVDLRGNGVYAAVDLRDGCWFLAGDGNCAIEVEHGRALKPSTCRLFPFNRVYRLGGVRVVDVNSVICPVEAAGGSGVRWAELERELASLEGSPLLDWPAHEPEGLSAAWLTVERNAAEAAAACGNSPQAFAEALGDRASEAAVEAWARVYNIARDELAAREREVAPRVALIAASLRWNSLFHKEAGPYPRVLLRLPRRLRALTFLAALGARGIGGAPSLRGITELWQGQADALDVLARWDEPVRVAGQSFDADVPPNLHAALGRLLAGAFRGGRTLGQLVEECAASLPAPERPLAVALAASQLPTLFA